MAGGIEAWAQAGGRGPGLSAKAQLPFQAAQGLRLELPGPSARQRPEESPGVPGRPQQMRRLQQAAEFRAEISATSSAPRR